MKQTIITILLALVAMTGTSDAFNFRIDHKDVAIAVNKDITGNQVPVFPNRTRHLLVSTDRAPWQTIR